MKKSLIISVLILTVLLFFVACTGSKGKKSRADGGGGGVDGAPTAPQNVQAQSGPGQIRLTWKPVDGADNYEVHWSSSADVSPATGTVETTQDTQFTHANLSIGDVYYYIVLAVNSKGKSPASGTVTGQSTYGHFDPTPRAFKATAGNAQVQLQWAPVEAAASYNLYWSKNNDVSKFRSTAVSASEPNYLHTGLTNGKTYYYLVTALTASGESGSSSLASATPVDPPQAVFILATESREKATAIYWRDQANIQTYVVYWSTQSGFVPAPAASARLKQPRYFHLGLLDDTDYFYRVEVINAAGSAMTAEFTVHAAPAVTVPVQPKIGSASSGRDNVIITWPVADRAGAYDLYWSSSDVPLVRQSGTRIADVTSPYTHTDLAPGRYQYLLVAKNTVGESAASAVVSTPVAPNWLHQEVYQNLRANEQASDVAAFGENIYVLTNSPSDLAATGKFGVDDDVVVIKYNSDGRQVWLKQFGSFDFDLATAMAVDAQGNILVTGWTMGDIVNRAVVHNDQNVFVAKLDADGNRLWTRQYGSELVDQGIDVAVDNNGAVYVAGSTRGEFLTISKDKADDDGFVLKLDANGNPQWVDLIGSPQYDTLGGIMVDGESVTVIGTTRGALGDIAKTDNEHDVFLLQYHLGGERQWIDQVSIPSTQWGIGLAKAADGSLVWTGYAPSGTTANTQLQILLGKHMADGTPVWRQSAGSAAADEPKSLAAGSDGTIYVAGGTRGALGVPEKTGADSDMFLLLFDTNGVQQSVRQYGAAGNEYLKSLVVSGGVLYMAGSTSDRLDGLTEPAKSTTDWDVILKREAP